MARTTILLNDLLERRLRLRAKKEGKTLTQMIQEFIRDGLNKPSTPKPSRELDLPAFHMGKAAIDPADRSRLLDFLDEQ